MYQRILVAVDGTAAAEQALQQALGLARLGGAEIRIVHVVNLVTLAVETLDELSEFETAVREAGHRVLQHARDIAAQAGIPAEAHCVEIQRFGHRVAEEIVQDAKQWSADLIVLGTHGANRLLLGSVAEAVVRMAPTPVLLVPA